MNEPFGRKTAIVTGAGRGIGHAIVRLVSGLPYALGASPARKWRIQNGITQFK